jgi:hypothetical protein
MNAQANQNGTTLLEYATNAAVNHEILYDCFIHENQKLGYVL